MKKDTKKDATIKQIFPVVGMSCAACAARVDKTLNSLEGVTASVNYAAAAVTVSYPPEACSPEKLRDNSLIMEIILGKKDENLEKL